MNYLHNNIKFGLMLFLTSFIVSPIRAQLVERNATSMYVHEDTREGLKISYTGKITPTENLRTIQSISDDGFLKIEKFSEGVDKNIYITNSEGNLVFQYTEGGLVKPYEPNGQKFLAEILPEILKKTTIAAESKVNELFKEGGLDAVINALPELETDHVKAAYLIFLLDHNIQKEEDLQKIMKVVETEIDSDHYRTEVLEKLFQNRENTLSSFGKALETIESDHYKTQLLIPRLKQLFKQGSNDTFLELLDLIDSDHYKSEIIKSLDIANLNDQEFKNLLSIIGSSIDSDHYKKELLSFYLDRNDLKETRVVILMDHSNLIQSEHYKAEFLKEICNSNPTEKIKEILIQHAKSFKSDMYYGKVMRCLE